MKQKTTLKPLKAKLGSSKSPQKYKSKSGMVAYAYNLTNLGDCQFELSKLNEALFKKKNKTAEDVAQWKSSRLNSSTTKNKSQ